MLISDIRWLTRLVLSDHMVGRFSIGSPWVREVWFSKEARGGKGNCLLELVIYGSSTNPMNDQWKIFVKCLIEYVEN